MYTFSVVATSRRDFSLLFSIFFFSIVYRTDSVNSLTTHGFKSCLLFQVNPVTQEIIMVEDKKAKKAAMKDEAVALGISYDELKEREKKKKREAEALESEEHKGEAKRLRSYSKDLDGEQDTKRRRTRSMDAKEENENISKEAKKLTFEEWSKEQELKLRGHGDSLGMKMPEPFIEFKDTPFSEKILAGFVKAGFARPSAIQAMSWPLADMGKDLISVAKTGSGKTCAFLLPVFHYLEKGGQLRAQRPKPTLLVLAPTRELSVQILEETQKFGRPLGIGSVCCYGGSPKYPQIAALQRGVECVIATPGRLNDLLESRKADLSTIKYLVLDEADRMLDMVRLLTNESTYIVS
jgi:ATP-dependent RNA helicase DDX5/DBP2